jgi:hypothetical protein
VIYSGYGHYDFWVSRSSATHGVIEKQCQSFPKGHKALVKPTGAASPQEIWLSDIVELTTRNREDIRLELHARSSAERLRLPMAESGGSDSRGLVVELLLELDGDKWWNACRQALFDASSGQCPVINLTEIEGSARVPDLLVCVLAAENLLVERADTSQLVGRAHAAFLDYKRDVRVVVVGHGSDDAKQKIINRLGALGRGPATATLFVGSVDDEAQLYRQLRKYLAQKLPIEAHVAPYGDSDPRARETGS